MDETHLSLDEMAAIPHVLQSGTLSSDPVDQAALERALGPLKEHSIWIPAWPGPWEDPAKTTMTAGTTMLLTTEHPLSV